MVRRPQPTATLSIADLEATFGANEAATEQARVVTAEAAKEAQPTCRVYGGDPSALWNRLFCALYARVGDVGETVGADQLDLSQEFDLPDRLLEDPDFVRVLAVADEFLRTHGESLAHSPVERGFLQRDVWKVADALAVAPGPDDDPTFPTRINERRQMLLRRLVPIMRRLAMSRATIEAAPDNLSQAIAARAFPVSFNAANEAAGFLPPNLVAAPDHTASDLATPDGPWLVLGRAGGPLATAHLAGLFGDMNQSAWLVMMRGAGDRRTAAAFLATLAATARADAGELAVPPGTEFALVRRMMLIDDTGSIVPSPVTEEIRLRHYDLFPSFAGSPHLNPDQVFVAMHVARESLFRGQTGGLEKEMAGRSAEECSQCHTLFTVTHAHVSASTINSFSRPFTQEDEIRTRPGPLRVTTARNELAECARWLMAQPDFAKLKKYW